jgi:fucose permease
MNKLAVFQGIFYLMTGLWAIIDIQSFMAVTGPKIDIWLVHTVSLLLISIGLTLLVSSTNPFPLASAVLGGSSAFSLAIIDFYYSMTKIISPVYLVDAFIEVALVVIWIFIFQKRWQIHENKSTI